MDQKYRFDGHSETPIAYIRPVPIDELPVEMRENAGDLDHVYAVHDAEGQRLALVESRVMGFILARQNQMAPVNVH